MGSDTSIFSCVETFKRLDAEYQVMYESMRSHLFDIECWNTSPAHRRCDKQKLQQVKSNFNKALQLNDSFNYKLCRNYIIDVLNVFSTSFKDIENLYTFDEDATEEKQNINANEEEKKK